VSLFLPLWIRPPLLGSSISIYHDCRDPGGVIGQLLACYSDEKESRASIAWATEWSMARYHCSFLLTRNSKSDEVPLPFPPPRLHTIIIWPQFANSPLAPAKSEKKIPMSFVGSELSQAPSIPMWSSCSSLGARSPASEWVHRPELHAHHAPGALVLSPSCIRFCGNLQSAACSTCLGFPACPAGYRSHPSQLLGRIRDLDRHQQRLGDIGIPRAWKVIPMSCLGAA
jgi:hypothetical protein